MPIADPLPLITERVALRRLRADDLVAFQSYRTDRELGLYQGWEPMPEAQASAFIDAMRSAPLLEPGRWIQVAIADPADLRLLGDVGLLLAEDARHAEVGFTLSRPAQGRGLATAAVRAAIDLVFALTPAVSVIGIADARNHASIRVLERAGMRLQIERDSSFRGAICREHVYAVQRPAASVHRE